ncbi:MAG: hypothetical protein J6K85_01950 [Clostridia bacterium]|nr:hypothetical protein [Clostridia bacterium]
MIIYSKSSGNTPAAIGRLETPIKMIIEHESELLSAKGGICDSLFNVEKSNRFGETIVGGNEFDVFEATTEGEAATPDTVVETYQKFIEHIQFMKEFVISAEMMEDANYGIAADAKRRIENFVRAYYKTVNKICEFALANGLEINAKFGGASLDLAAPDGYSLFHKNHTYGSSATPQNGTQSNYFYGDILSSTEAFEEALSELAVKLRYMKDESGEPLGYTADTIVLPGNRPEAEIIARKVCGSERSLGNSYNDVNLHYGKWNIVVLPNWQTTDNRVMIMSSEANKSLCGNMFFNRIPLTVTNWVDNHTGNYIWNGRCRFGVGFGTYKHILLAIDSTTAISDATAL